MIWISAYLYCSPPWEKFLISKVKPLCDELVESKLVESFFFIRYWENGPHIRLRLNCNDLANSEIVKGSIISYFTPYFTSEETMESSTPHIAESYEISNKLIFKDYEPEYERYGGAVGVKLAEKYFCNSSKIILDVLVSKKDISYENLIGIALQMQLVFIHCSGFTGSDVIRFFKGSFLGAELIDYEGSSIVDQQQFIEDRTKRYDAFLERHQEKYSAHISQLWNILNQGVKFQEGWMNDWVSNCYQYHFSFVASYNSKTLDVQYSEDILSDSFIIFTSLVHMTNNRLGIANVDESLIAMILEKSLSNNE